MSRDLNVDQIKKLWILDLIISSGSLKKAALKAHVSPSAVSQTLTGLEHAIGKPLLVRERGRVTPTPEALAILEVIRPAFAAFDRLRDISQIPVPQMSWLNFGTYESIAIDILPGMIQSLKEKMPNLRLGVRISRTANLLTMVRKGELCSALVTEVDDIDRFYSRDVASDRLGLYVSSRHPIAEKGWRAMEEFGVASLAPSKDGLPRYFTKFMKQFDSAKPFLLSDSFETLRAAACGGSVVAVLPERVARRSEGLVEISVYKGRPLRELGRHRIVVLSMLKCDPAETDFLAVEASRHLSRN